MKHLYEMHANICKTLANPKRIEIINTLRDKELSAGKLLKILKIKKANLSQHLSVMRSKGIVRTRRDGQNIFYRISNPKVIRACDIMRQVLIEHLAEANNTAKKWRER